MKNLNLALAEPVFQRLESLRDSTQAESMAEVIRRALAIYELICAEKSQGSSIVVKATDGTERQIIIL